MHALIHAKLGDIERVCHAYSVRRLEVFGSAARGNDFDAACSDIDLLVEFGPGAQKGLAGYFELKAALERLFDRSVDMVEQGAIRNPFLLAAINRDRHVVYAT